MPQNASNRVIGELTFMDVARRLSPRSVLCLPIGSIEQHGPHLPLNTDAVLAEEFARRIVERWGETYDLWRLPTIAVSLAREHEWAAGTMSLSVEGMTVVLHDLGRSLARSSPARNLAIINGHGGNRGILEALAQDLRADCRLNVCVMHPAAWAEDRQRATASEIHGGKNETSIMLAVAPQLVRRDQIAQLKMPPTSDAVRAIILDPAVTWPWTTNDKQIADMGVIGDAKAASAEFGEQLLEHITEKAGGVLRQLLDRQHLVEG